MTRGEQCSAYVPGGDGQERACRNGFATTAACWGGCAPALPLCLQTENAGRIYNASGGVPRVIADTIAAPGGAGAPEQPTRDSDDLLTDPAALARLAREAIAMLSVGGDMTRWTDLHSEVVIDALRVEYHGAPGGAGEQSNG